MPKYKDDLQSEYDLGFSFQGFNLPKFLYGLIFWCTLILLFLPLLGEYGSLLFPLGRDIVMRMLVEIMAVAYIGLLIFSPSAKPSFSWISVFLFLFLAVNGIATMFSPQKVFAFWGIIYRSQGFFSLVHYSVLFLILSAVFKTWQEWKKFLLAAFSINMLVVLVSFLELRSHAPRLMSTLNNPNFYGAYLLLVFFLTLAFAVAAKEKLHKMILVAGAIVQLLALFFTYTRGAYLGLAVGSLAFFFLFLNVGKKIKGAAAGTLLVFGLLYALIILVNPGNVLAPLSQSKYTGRIFGIGNLSTTLLSRTEAWHAGLEGIKARPFFGYGPENFIIPFDTYYRGTLDHIHFLETWFDRAHNVIIDIGAATGIPGLLAYFGILGTSLWTILKIRRNAKTSELRFITGGIFATIIAYFVQNLLNFDTTTSFLYFTFLLGFIVFLERQIHHQPSEIPFAKMAKTSNKKTVLAIGLMLLFIPLLVFSFKKWHFDFLAANYYLNEAENYFQIKDYKKAFSLYDRGLAYNAPPVNPHLRYRYASAILSYALDSKNTAPDKVIAMLKNGLVLLEENVKKEFPYFTRNYLTSGIIANILLELDQKEYAAAADEYFKKALELSPKRPFTINEWAKTHFLIKDYRGGKELLKQSLTINPKVTETYWLLGIGALYQHNYDEAQGYFLEAKKHGLDIDSVMQLMQLVFVYNQLEDWPKLLEIYDKIIAKEPDNAQYYASLAMVYKKMGNSAKAKETALQILKLKPSTKTEVEEFIKTLSN